MTEDEREAHNVDVVALDGRDAVRSRLGDVDEEHAVRVGARQSDIDAVEVAEPSAVAIEELTLVHDGLSLTRPDDSAGAITNNGADNA